MAFWKVNFSNKAAKQAMKLDQPVLAALRLLDGLVMENYTAKRMNINGIATLQRGVPPMFVVGS